MTSGHRTHTSRIVFNLNDAEGGRRDVAEGGRKGGVWGGGEDTHNTHL